MLTQARLLAAIESLERWVLCHEFHGYDPFDGLTSYLRPLALGNLLLERVLMQTIRQSPVNLRPILGVKPLDSTIGRGYMSGGFIEMLKITGEAKYETLARGCLDWLVQNKSSDCATYSWGKHFDYASRGGRYRKYEPITVWTSLIGQVFFDAYEFMGKKEYLDISRSACDWILALPRNVTNSGICLSYHLFQKGKCTIHNHNMLAAALLARVGKCVENQEYLKLAEEAMSYSCHHQRTDGAWYYGESANTKWVDGFHTGYNLDALKCYIENSGNRRFETNIERGLAYYTANLFEPDGTPKYYDQRKYPIDIQCAAQGIETLVKFSAYDVSTLELAKRVAEWTIGNFQDKKGFFYYRQYPGGIKARMPMIHWGQSTMYKALALLLSKLADENSPA